MIHPEGRTVSAVLEVIQPPTTYGGTVRRTPLFTTGATDESSRARSQLPAAFNFFATPK